MSKLLLTGVGCLLLTGAASMSPISQQAAPDFESIPPSIAEIASMVDGATISIAKAIEIAATETAGGTVTAALYNIEKKATLIDVEVLADSKRYHMVIDASNGQVMSKTPAPRFAGDDVEGDWTETDSGLKYYDIRVGEGPQPAGPTSRVEVHYSGWLLNGVQFDSSVERGKPLTFALNGVIAGWTEGVGSMRVGGKRKLVIPYNLAYGPAGRGPIPPRATLIFDVELLGIEDQ